jgi:6-phosphogluconolactonase (cycloisomerase 2 family)
MSNGLPVVSSEQYMKLVDASSVSDFVLSADDRYMYVADDSQGTIRVYQNSNQTLTPIQGAAQASSFSAGIRPSVLRLSSDGQYLYSFQNDVSSGTLASFSVRAGQLNALATASVTSGSIVDISLSPNGQYMAVASESAEADFLSLYQLNQGQMTLVTSMELSTPSALRSIRFSPNGQYIYAMVTDSRSSVSGSIYTCAGPSQAATDTLGALLNAHSTPAKGAQTLFNLRPDQPVFTPMPASQPSTLVVVP